MDRRRFFQLSAGTAALAALEWSGQPAVGMPAITSSNALSAADFHRARKFVETQQGRIACLDMGKGPGALFLHGFPLNSFQWRGVIPQLSSLRRCIAPDFLALGYTEVADGQSVGPQAQVEMLVQLLDKLSISAVDIVANDSGGAIAQLFVTRFPDRASSLILTNCDTEPDSPPAAVLPVIALGRAGKFADTQLAPWLADKQLARSEHGLGGQCYSNPAHPTDEAIETYLAPLLSTPRRKNLTDAYAAALNPNPLVGVTAALKKCYVATRVVWGTADSIFATTSADFLAQTVANSLGLRRVPGAKLFFPEEMPELIIEEAKWVWSL
jgi:pimeloyl-ACP methyl ester carboxylesterase